MACRARSMATTVGVRQRDGVECDRLECGRFPTREGAKSNVWGWEHANVEPANLKHGFSQGKKMGKGWQRPFPERRGGPCERLLKLRRRTHPHNNQHRFLWLWYSDATIVSSGLSRIIGRTRWKRRGRMGAGWVGRCRLEGGKVAGSNVEGSPTGVECMVSIGSIVSIGQGVRAGMGARPYERTSGQVMEMRVGVKRPDCGQAWKPAPT